METVVLASRWQTCSALELKVLGSRRECRVEYYERDGGQCLRDSEQCFRTGSYRPSSETGVVLPLCFAILMVRREPV